MSVAFLNHEETTAHLIQYFCSIIKAHPVTQFIKVEYKNKLSENSKIYLARTVCEEML